MGRLLTVGAILAVAVGAVLFVRGEIPCDVVSFQPSCDVTLAPGPTEDILELVTFDGTDSYPPPDGELQLTTVAVKDELSLGDWLDGRTSDLVEVVPRETVYPEGTDEAEVAELNAAAMADSQLVATVAALERVGYELDPQGALVAGVAEDAVTDELAVDDVIVGVDGEAVEESADVVEQVRSRSPGDRLALDVRRDDDEREVEVTLGAAEDDPDRGYIGVFLTTDLDLPVDVDIDAGSIGGPSAGLMFALSIIELLEPDDLIDGRVVAGTGTLDHEGEVGAVGGVRQKVTAVTTGDDGARAEVFLVPRDNLGDARQAPVGEDLLVVPVDTIDDAISALEALADGREPEDAELLAAP
ncbi:MAG: PDZ domain-containing protein [Nitriliruptoraceae bacterium]